MKVAQTLLASLALVGAANTHAVAQCCQTYRLEYQTVFEDRQVTAYRLGVETVYRRAASHQLPPGLGNRDGRSGATTSRPVIETSERRGATPCSSQSGKRQCATTATTSSATSSRPANAKQRCVVQRPVTETQERRRRIHSCSRPVTETMERDEVYTVMTPVTTYRAVTVDQGTYVAQQTVVPGRVVNRLQWVPVLASPIPPRANRPI